MSDSLFAIQSNMKMPPTSDQSFQSKQDDDDSKASLMDPIDSLFSSSMQSDIPPPTSSHQSQPPQQTNDSDKINMELMSQMMSYELCVVCNKSEGFKLSCSHNVCSKCLKKYILNGIATIKWKNESLACPS
eukprot:543432_1